MVRYLYQNLRLHSTSFSPQQTESSSPGSFNYKTYTTVWLLFKDMSSAPAGVQQDWTEISWLWEELCMTVLFLSGGKKKVYLRTHI